MKSPYDMRSFLGLIRNWKLRYIFHWKPHYILSRIRVFFDEARHPDCPWLTKEASSILSTMLKPTDAGLEYGSGRSTLWLAQLIKHLTSVEDDESWYKLISNKLKVQNISNVHYLLCQAAGYEKPEESPYVQTIDTFGKNSLDFVLVDGKYRDVCACIALEKIRPGGFIVIDDANRYIPCDSTSPNSTPKKSPPASEKWSEFLDCVKDWRYIWTTNGIKDTVILLKPVPIK